MTGIELYSTTAANNNSAPPNGWPEGQAPSSVNDCARQMMAAIRTWYETAEWLNLGHIPTYVSGTSFTIPTDLTTTYQVGRRIRLVGTTPFTLYATIATSSYSAPNTTVTLTMDSGTIDATISAISISINSVTNKSITSDMISGLSGYVTLTGTQTLTNKTLTSPKVNEILDTNGNELVKFTTTAIAVNELTVTNAVTGSGATLSATGGDTNIDVNILAKGTGAVNLKGTATTAAEVRLFEDTDNGTNYVGLKAPASASSSVTFTLPSADGTSGQFLKTNGSGSLSFDSSKLINRVKTLITGTTSGATAIPLDSTIPQITEGFLFGTAAGYTPASASNVIVVRAFFWIGGAAVNPLFALFQDSTANAVAAGMGNGNATICTSQELTYEYTAGSTSPTTFTFRVGSNGASTFYLNRDPAGNTLGGMVSYFEITEYAP